MRRVLVLLLASATVGSGAELFKDKRETAILLTLAGVKQVQLHLLAKPRRNAELAAELARRGAVVRARLDDIDYLRAIVPLADVGELRLLAAHPAIEAIDLATSGLETIDYNIPLPPPDVGDFVREPARPLLHPYLPITDLGGAAFVRAHPTFDGRGVTVGILDGIPDLLQPALQWSRDARGQRVPKLRGLDVIGGADDSPSDKNWVRMNEVVQAADGRFRVGGTEYRSPRDGRFRFGLLPRPQYGPVKHWVPLADQAADEAVLLPVLWEESTDTIWVDTNADHSFTEERAVRPYAVANDLGIFGHEDPSTAERETVAFTVSVDHAATALRINLGWAEHGTMVAGCVAASGLNGGSFDGVAPGAQLHFFQRSAVRDSDNAVETLHAAMADPTVDVVVFEPATSLVMQYGLCDGRHALTLAIDRLCDRYPKLLFIPAGNVTGLAALLEPSIARHAIAVGTYDSAGSLRRNALATSPAEDNLHRNGAFGPAGNGRLKPDLVVPAGFVTTMPESFNLDGRWRIPGLASMPFGFGMAGGSSGAAPTAAGAAAVLISAARQSNIRCDAARLRAALLASGRELRGFSSYQQGLGVLQIERAWEILVALNRQPDWQPAEIEVRAPVHTPLSRYLRTPDQGEGIFETEGWEPNAHGRRVLVLTRRNGPIQPVTYVLSWSGDAGSFHSPATVTLPLDQPVELPVEIQTGESRVYSAILRLRRETEPVDAAAILNTIVAAEPLVRDDSWRASLEIPRPGVRSLFVRVPSGVDALRLRAAKLSRETLLFSAYAPDFVLKPGIPRATLRGGSAQFVVPHPSPGVWEIVIDNRAMLRDDLTRAWVEPRPEPLSPTTVEVTIDLMGVEVQGTVDGSIALRNSGAAWDATAVAAVPVVREEGTSELLAGETFFRDVVVAEGTAFFQVTIDGLPESADAQFLLFRMEQNRPVLRHRARGPATSFTAVFERPEAGTWKIVLDPFRIPGKTRFHFQVAKGVPAISPIGLDPSQLHFGSGEERRVKWRITSIDKWPTNLAVAVMLGADARVTPESPGDRGMTRTLVSTVVDLKP